MTTDTDLIARLYTAGGAICVEAAERIAVQVQDIATRDRQLAEARAEIARLTAELDGLKLAIEKAGDAFGDYRLRAENERLQFVIEEAGKHLHDITNHGNCSSSRQLARYALAALQRKAGE